jgi:3D (Asp-Asp-Asp) domain-containing protein
MRGKLLAFALALAAVIVLVSCGGHTAIPPSNGSGAPNSTTLGPAITQASCYNGDTKPAYTTTATVTFYGWPDNSPPGNQIAHPVIHQDAGGDGSYCNPTTFATEPTSTENSKIPYGTRIYVPYVHKYFIREDDCTTSGPQGLGCSGLWFDLWIGGDAKSRSSAVINCENNLTQNGKVQVIVHAPPNEPVAWTGPIYNDFPPPNGSCNKPAGSPSPSPSPSPGGKTVNATVIFYGYPDNGNSCAIAHPIIHSCASGTGTYADPITFATSTANDSTIPYGAIVYVPFMQRYFIREDDCGSGECGGYTFNLWVGGNSSDVASDVEACEASLTPSSTVPVILNPPTNEYVTSLGPIWNESNGECNGTYNY